MQLPEKTSAEQFRNFVPGALVSAGSGAAWTDVLLRSTRATGWKKA